MLDPARVEVVQFLSCCPAGVYFTLPLGESSLSEERATAPCPPLADARPSRKREGKSLDIQQLINCTTSERESEVNHKICGYNNNYPLP